MGIYNDLSDIVMEILSALKNQDRLDEFLRLVGYDGNDALSTSETIPSFNSLIWNRLFPFIKPLNPEKDKGTYVSVYLKDPAFAGANNVYQHDIPFKLEFLCNKDLWALKDKKIRPYELLGVIYDALNSAEIEKSIRGKLVVNPPKLLVAHGGEYAGYSFEMKLTGIAEDCNE